MGRVVAFLLVNLAAWLLLRRLWPAVRSRKGAVAFWSIAAVAVGAWALPIVLGLGVHGALPGVGSAFRIFGAMWMVATLGLVLVGWPLYGIGRLVARWSNRASGPEDDGPRDPGRRRLLGGFGKAMPVAAIATSSVGIAEGTKDFTVKREEVRIDGLPPALDGFRIGQITDVHVGAFIDVDFVRRAVAAMNAEGVELQVMTGDLIDDLTQLDGTMAALDSNAARHGMLAVLGNHEHWRGPGEVRQAYDRCERVRLLDDEHTVIEHEGAKLRVVGVDYPMRTRGETTAVMRSSADAAFGTPAPDETVLCLSHHPDFFPIAAERGAHLTLAGHTHGGQVAFAGVSAFFFAYRHMLGRYRRDGKHLYVSGGTGHWLPFRVGVPSEVTILTLRRA